MKRIYKDSLQLLVSHGLQSSTSASRVGGKGPKFEANHFIIHKLIKKDLQRVGFGCDLRAGIKKDLPIVNFNTVSLSCLQTR